MSTKRGGSRDAVNLRDGSRRKRLSCLLSGSSEKRSSMVWKPRWSEKGSPPRVVIRFRRAHYGVEIPAERTGFLDRRSDGFQARALWCGNPGTTIACICSLTKLPKPIDRLCLISPPLPTKICGCSTRLPTRSTSRGEGWCLSTTRISKGR